MAADAASIARGETVEGRYLTYFLSQTKLPMKTIYSNITELLLAGVDTVRSCPLLRSPVFVPSKKLKLFFLFCVFSDLQHLVLDVVRAVPSPKDPGRDQEGGADGAGGSEDPRGRRRGQHASPEGHSQRGAQVNPTKCFLFSVLRTFIVSFHLT